MEGEAAADPPDDESIAGKTKILRRIVPGRFSRRTGQPEDSAFRRDGDGSGTSVTLWLTDVDLEITRAPHPSFGIVALYVSEIRAEGLTIAFVEEHGNPNHCEVFGQMSGSRRRKLSEIARWVAYPVGYPAELMKPLWSLGDE